MGGPPLKVMLFLDAGYSQLVGLPGNVLLAFSAE